MNVKTYPDGAIYIQLPDKNRRTIAYAAPQSGGGWRVRHLANGRTTTVDTRDEAAHLLCLMTGAVIA